MKEKQSKKNGKTMGGMRKQEKPKELTLSHVLEDVKEPEEPEEGLSSRGKSQCKGPEVRKHLGTEAAGLAEVGWVEEEQVIQGIDDEEPGIF